MTKEQAERLIDLYDQGNARLINKGINVMSVTYADAKRMLNRGWLNQQAAERFGLGKEAV